MFTRLFIGHGDHFIDRFKLNAGFSRAFHGADLANEVVGSFLRDFYLKDVAALGAGVLQAFESDLGVLCDVFVILIEVLELCYRDLAHVSLTRGRRCGTVLFSVGDALNWVFSLEGLNKHAHVNSVQIFELKGLLEV